MGRLSAAEPAHSPDLDPRVPLSALRKELGTGSRGLSGREAARRLTVYGPNEVRAKKQSSLGRELARQLIHPLALLLWIRRAPRSPTRCAAVTRRDCACTS